MQKPTIDTEAPTWESLSIDLPTRYVLHGKGITPEDVTSYQEAGTSKLHEMLSLKAVGVTGKKALAYAMQGVDYETMVSLARRQISPETLADMRKLYPGATPAQAIKLKSSGLSKSLMSALTKIGITDPTVMARFANSRITAKDLDEYRRAGAKPEDFGWDPEHRWINRPTVEKIMLRTLGLPADLGEYLPRFNDHKKRWEEEELAIAQVALSSGVPSWF
jgi:hypothetical protein